MSLFAKAMDVINSCQTVTQLKVAQSWLGLAYPKMKYETALEVHKAFRRKCFLSCADPFMEFSRLPEPVEPR